MSEEATTITQITQPSTPPRSHPIYDLPSEPSLHSVGMVELVDIDTITIPERLRYATDETSQAALQSLIDSIHRHGLLQPILVDQHNNLQAGWRRLSACKLLGWITIPAYRRERLSEAQYHEWELEENFRRLDFTWQETVIGVCRVHRARVSDAARDGKTWTQSMTGELLGGYSKSYVSNCFILEPWLEKNWKTKEWLHPEVADCETITDALRLLYRKKEDDAVAELARRTQLTKATSPTRVVTPSTSLSNGSTNGKVSGDTDVDATNLIIPPDGLPQGDNLLNELLSPEEIPEVTIDLSHMLFHGDCTDLLAGWPAECVDHIITDPPYGIDTTNMNQSNTSLMDTSRVDETHDVIENLSMFPLMLRAFHHVLRPGGYCIIWCDIMNWQLLYDLATNVGFRVQRWPIDWVKLGACKNQMAHVNITKATEIAMVMAKGKATLPSPVSKNYFMAASDAAKVSNPFAKPYDLWKFCVESVSIQGQTILEPFAGEGSGVLSMLRLNRRVLAIEKDERHFNVLLNDVKNHFKSTLRKVRFV